MRIATHMLDRGVRTAVGLLNSIDGVTTRASCEGRSDAQGHRHSDLAYVAFEFPLPTRLQNFLIAELDMIARVEDDAVYCRWPQQNPQFLARLSEVVRQYKRRERRQRRAETEYSLSKLRSHLVAKTSSGQEMTASLCLRCEALVLGPHDCDGTTLTLLRWPADQNAQRFGDFLEQPGNSLDASLVAVLGADELEERARRGDFGSQFRRRWLRYRSEQTHLQMTRGLRAGIQHLRTKGTDVDVTFATDRARFTWRASRKVTP